MLLRTSHRETKLSTETNRSITELRQEIRQINTNLSTGELLRNVRAIESNLTIAEITRNQLLLEIQAIGTKLRIKK